MYCIVLFIDGDRRKRRSNRKSIWRIHNVDRHVRWDLGVRFA